MLFWQGKKDLVRVPNGRKVKLRKRKEEIAAKKREEEKKRKDAAIEDELEALKKSMKID